MLRSRYNTRTLQCLCCLTMACIYYFSCTCVFALDISKYEIVHESLEEGMGWDNYINFLDSEVKVWLWQTRHSVPPSEESLLETKEIISKLPCKIQWLLKDRLLWISWQTGPTGNGYYYNEAHIIATVEGGRAVELYRECFMANGNQGAGNHHHLDITFKFDEEHRQLTKIILDTSYSSSSQKRPLTILADGIGPYHRDVDLEQRTTYLFNGKMLRRFGTRLSLDLGEHEFPLREVAEYFVKRTSKSWRKGKVSDEQLEGVVKTLRKENRIEPEQDKVKGKLKLKIGSHLAIRPMPPEREEYMFR